MTFFRLFLVVTLLSGIALTASTARPADRPTQCRVGQTAPSFNDWTWPSGSHVKVFVRQPDFSPSQAQLFIPPISNWDEAARSTSSAVRFSYAGLTSEVATCPSCLTIVRGQVFSTKGFHLAEAQLEATPQHVLVRGALVIDRRVTNEEELADLVAHELGHTMGLKDCYECRRGSTVMRGFDGINRSNRMVEPSGCDLAAVADAYAHAGRRHETAMGAARSGDIHVIIEDEGEEPEPDDTIEVLTTDGNAAKEPTAVITEETDAPPALAPVAHGDELASIPFEALSAAQRQEILDRVAANETAFREALNQYGFKRLVVLQTVGPHGEITGQYLRTSQFIFDDHGRRLEKLLFHPKSTIHELRITKEDIQDLAGVQPFGFEASQLDRYRFELLGTDILNGQRTYVISVTPKQAPDPHKMKERYFVGKLWVDATSYTIRKMRGVAEPQGKQRFPVFETVREQVDGNYWFPLATEADDILRFPRQSVHYRISVRYEGYKRFAGKVRIIEEGEPGAEADGAMSFKPRSSRIPLKSFRLPHRYHQKTEN